MNRPDLVGILMVPKPRAVSDHVYIPSHQSHIAVGIWLGLAAILFLPGRTSRRCNEKDLLRAYGIAMQTFPLV